MSDNYCWSHGPRIGDEGKPVCFREAGHTGAHESHPDSGFRERWGAPDMTIPEHARDDYWTPQNNVEGDEMSDGTNGRRIATTAMRTAHLDSGATTGTRYSSMFPVPLAICGTPTASAREIEREGITDAQLAKLPLCKRCQKAHDKELGVKA